eukprot:6790-Amphidinium_carterae.1
MAAACYSGSLAMDLGPLLLATTWSFIVSERYMAEWSWSSHHLAWHCMSELELHLISAPSMGSVRHSHAWYICSASCAAWEGLLGGT